MNEVHTPPAENSTGKDLLTTLNEAIKAVLNDETERANWPKDSSGRTDWTPTEGETYVEIPADRGPKGPDGRSIYEVQAELEVTADEASATEAAEEASKAAQVALGENPPPLPFAAGYDDYDFVGETDEAQYYHFGVELEDGGTLEEIMAVSKLDGSEVTVTIETNGDG